MRMAGRRKRTGFTSNCGPCVTVVCFGIHRIMIMVFQRIPAVMVTTTFMSCNIPILLFPEAQQYLFLPSSIFTYKKHLTLPGVKNHMTQ